jgi:hypothetical protein
LASSGEATAPWGRACLRWQKISFFHHASLQPLAKAIYTTITDTVFDKAHQPLVTDRIEESRYIGVDYPVHLRADNLSTVPERSLQRDSAEIRGR